MGQKASTCVTCPKMPYRIFNLTSDVITVKITVENSAQLVVHIQPKDKFDFISNNVEKVLVDWPPYEAQMSKEINLMQKGSGTYALTSNGLIFRDVKILDNLTS